MYPQLRHRRLRKTTSIRNLVREVRLTPANLVYPIFIDHTVETPEPIVSMPGQFRFPVKGVVEKIEEALSLGIHSIILFGLPKNKDENASGAYADDGVVQESIELIRREFNDQIAILTDVCLCQYTSHGHCGVLRDGEIANDQTVEILQKIAVSHAAAGADIVAPSGMMDGQVAAIRKALDEKKFRNVGIMAYAAKHASFFYGPFREAAAAAPSFGDRKTHQMDYANPNEALREVEMDIKEGADIVMVKPALAYLDLIRDVKKKFGYPTAAYNVSGEYSMIKAAAQKGWINEKGAVLEVLTGMRRAGADLILTYFALDASKWLSET
ncbi:MAG: porphobilinogen synthase [Candidatus Bathyarchaeia archaeon]